MSIVLEVLVIVWLRTFAWDCLTHGFGPTLRPEGARYKLPSAEVTTSYRYASYYAAR